MQTELAYKYEGSLHFLNDIRLNNTEEWTAPWLKSNFFDNEWLIRHGGHEVLLFNWDRMMPTGVYLSANGVDAKSKSSKIVSGDDKSSAYRAENDYRVALNNLKKITFYVAHRKISKRCNFGYHFSFFTNLLAFAEWAFLNEDRFNPRENLFSLIDATDLQNDFIPLFLTGGKSATLNLEQRLEFKLGEVLKSIKKNTDLLIELEASIKKCPALSYLDPLVEPWLMFNKKDTFLLRAWLLKNKYYLTASTQYGRLRSEVFFESIINQTIKMDSLSPALQMKIRAFYLVENIRMLDFPAANVREYFASGEKYLDCKALEIHTLSQSRFENTIGFFDKLKLISNQTEIGLPQKNVFEDLSLNRLTKTLDVKPPGRTKTIPAGIAMQLLGEAINYIVNFGDALVDSAIQIKQELVKYNTQNYTTSYCTKHAAIYTPTLLNLPHQLKKLNITQLGDIYTCTSHERLNASGGNARAKVARQQMGVENALSLLIASIIIVIGTTSARRQIEIRYLKSDCLEKIEGQGWYLRFALGKDNFGELKSKQSRCIPNITARAITLIRRLNSAWREFHEVEEDELFFGFTSSLATCEPLLKTRFDRALDLFCDFIQIPLDGEGKRWYVKTHQLRRFWAYAFFYKNGLGELSTIGWYLGHGETEQTWAYIMESFEGNDKELQQVKATYAADVLQNHRKFGVDETTISDLRNLVLHHFNKKNIKLIEKVELEDYIENLISTKNLEVQPKFIKDQNGNAYDIVFLLNTNGQIG